MARSFSNAKLLSGFISKAINGRGFAAVAATESQGVVSKGGAAAAKMVKKTGEDVVKSPEKVAWIPDPRTGCYRPANAAEEIDVAELRAALLKKH